MNRPLSILALERRYRAAQRQRGVKMQALKIDDLTPEEKAEFDARCVARQISRTEAIMELVRGETRMLEMAQ